MHELQIASDLMNAVLEAVKEHPNASRVEKVDLSIGRLSFVGDEQLRFCWGAITDECKLLKGCKLDISEEEVEISCRSCGYIGEMDVSEDPMYHFLLPVFACPECGGEVDITRGKGVTISNVRLMIDDGVEG
ncbi:MAG: hydrogenase maturation nickel metallochaperone HypA [Candidatus Thermoplasmatota archaeon]|nr:hydrogenase maturation nickel metallochaperone HypA [Candidatus Thermoplasmatota archaeon]